MFDEIDERYYRQRIDEETARAETATDTSAARTHRELAAEYQRKLEQLQGIKVD